MSNGVAPLARSAQIARVGCVACVACIACVACGDAVIARSDRSLEGGALADKWIERGCIMMRSLPDIAIAALRIAPRLIDTLPNADGDVVC